MSKSAVRPLVEVDATSLRSLRKHPPKRPDRSPCRPVGIIQDPTPFLAGTSPLDHIDDDHPNVSKSIAQETHATAEDLPAPTPGAGAAMRTYSYSDCRGSDSGFSRHDSLFSFGVSSSRNAAELKSLLGNANSRLKPGATVLSRHPQTTDKDTKKAHAVTLEQAKPRARVEVDIVLENDCCIEGGYMRGNVKIRVRKRQKKEAPVLLADGKVRVIGFECIPGERERHTFYQRANNLSAIIDASTGIYDSPTDEEGFARAVEGIHVLPFAMHLPIDIDDAFGSAKGVLSPYSEVALRYIAMISVKVKDSITGKRSIAHFYRDCQIWPRLDPSIVLASAPRPVQASTAKSLSVIGGSGKLKLTAMLHRMTWMAGQRCYVHIWIANDTKKSVKTVSLTLVRTTTLFKLKPHLSLGACAAAIDPDACQTATTHRVVCEAILERSPAAAKGHASAQGWWTGVQAGQEAQFSHYILIPPEALSVSRSRLLEVDYSIRVTASAGALSPDVHVTVPLRVINFLSIDPTPSEPLLSSDGSYARLVPYDGSPGPEGSPSGPSITYSDAAVSAAALHPHGSSPMATREYGNSSIAFIPSLSACSMRSALPAPAQGPRPGRSANGIVMDTPSCSTDTNGNVMASQQIGELECPDKTLMSTSGSARSMYSTDLCTSPTSSARHATIISASGRDLGNLELNEDAGSDEEVDVIVSNAQHGHDSVLPHAPDRPQASRTQGPPAGGDKARRAQTIRWKEMTPPSTRRARDKTPRGARSTPHSLRRIFSSSAASANTAGEDAGASGSISISVSVPEPRSGTRSRSIAGSDEDSWVVLSRELPQPPARPSYLCDVPASVSALEALRLSRLCAPPPDRATATPGATLPGTVYSRHTEPAAAARAPSFISSVPSSSSGDLIDSRAIRGRSTTVPVSISSTTAASRPAAALGDAGQSECSIVKGRIAAFEERVRHSQELDAVVT